MPVILDRLPLPNITWYSGISVLCLLCSVYYAGVQVKIHPNWKEQLLQRNALASANNARNAEDKYRYNGGETGDPPPLHWGVFNSNDQDEEGYCQPGDKEKENAGVLNALYNLIQERNQVCVCEDFEDILRAALYDEMCYIRYGSLDVAYSNYKNHNAARRAHGKSPYIPSEYTRRCQQAARKLAQKYNTSNPVANAINLNLKKNAQGGRVSEGKGPSAVGSSLFPESHDVNSGQSIPGKRSRKQQHEQPPAKAPVNQCTTDTFYDSYERAIDGEVSLYHIPLYDNGCDDVERELSPYLIPEIISFMFHEPLCIWTLINMAYCILILLGTTIQHMVFGELRVSEQQHIKDKFWNFVFYKFIFVFGVMNVKHMDEAVLWCSWFSVLGFLHLLAQLCKDRFEYLSFSGHTGRRTHIRLLGLLGIILLVATVCLVISVLVGCHSGINTFAFMAAECVLLIVRTLYVITRYSIYLWDITHQGLWEKRGGYVYAMELVFELSELTIDMVHHIHMLVWGNIMLTMASLVICMQLRLLFYQLQHKVKTHRNYLRVRTLLARYPEVHHPLSPEQEGITCAICWESVAKGRRLPCTHVFHTDCLLAWLPQHLSCPTCRHRLRPAASATPAIESGGLNFLSRLFSRRSSDPLDAGNSDASGNNSSTSNNSSRNNSRNASEQNSPQHPSAEAPPLVSGGAYDGSGSYREYERGAFASSNSRGAAGSSRALEERLVIISNSSGGAEAAVSHDGVTASFVYHNSDDDLLDEVTDEKPPKAGDNDDDDEMQHSSRGENANGFGGGSDSLLLDHDSVFWGTGDHHHRRRHHRGGAGAGGEGGRYVSWLSSFSVEQRHTQLRPQLNVVTPSAESSLHSMALQVQQMFPHMDYSEIISDLRRTRSIMTTVDNILEDNVYPSPPSRTSSYTPPSSSRPLASGTGSSKPTDATSASCSSGVQKPVPQTPTRQPTIKPYTTTGSVQETDSVKAACNSEEASTSSVSQSSTVLSVPQHRIVVEEIMADVPCTLGGPGQTSAVEAAAAAAAAAVSSAPNCSEEMTAPLFPGEETHECNTKHCCTVTTETDEDADNYQQYDVNEPNRLSGICESSSAEEDEEYIQIVQETSHGFVSTSENISIVESSSVGVFDSDCGKEKTSLRRRAVRTEKEKQASCGARRSEKQLPTKLRSRHSPLPDHSNYEEETMSRYSSNVERRRPELHDQLSDLFSGLVPEDESCVLQTATGDEDLFECEDDAVASSQRVHRKAGDVEVESARGASVQAVGSFGGRFSKSPSERESLLLGRQQLLYSTARNRLLKDDSSVPALPIDDAVGVCASDSTASFAGAEGYSSQDIVTAAHCALSIGAASSGSLSYIVDPQATPSSPSVVSDSNVTGDDTGTR